MSVQLPLFEGERPDKVRLTVTGATDTEQDPRLPSWKLGQAVRFVGTGIITKVTHATIKDGTMERQHVLVIDEMDFRPTPTESPDLVDAIARMVPDGQSSITVAASDGRSITITGGAP